MAVDYKLVRLSGSRMIMGQELYDQLTAENFQIPALPKVPSLPAAPSKLDEAAYIAWFNGPYTNYLNVMHQRSALNAAFEQKLRQEFQIATWHKTGQNYPNGSPIYGWTLRRIINPPYGTFAQKITGLKTKKPKNIRWIAFDSLYTDTAQPD